jgi:hypothetical protein
MIVVRGPTETTAIDDHEIKALVDLRFTQIWIGEQYDAEQHGYMVVVEPHDTPQSIEQETGCPILTNPYQETRFGDPDFSPLRETLEEHHGTNGTICYEMLFILNDDDSPCLGAQRVEIEPTRGLTTNPGRDGVGADVHREHFREGISNAVRPITGLDAKQFEVQGRRMKLTADAQRECRRLNADIPVAEIEEQQTAKQQRGEVQSRLFIMRKRFTDLRC